MQQYSQDHGFSLSSDICEIYFVILSIKFLMSYTCNFHFEIIRLFHVIQFFNCQVVLIKHIDWLIDWRYDHGYSLSSEK